MQFDNTSRSDEILFHLAVICCSSLGPLRSGGDAFYILSVSHISPLAGVVLASVLQENEEAT